MGKALSVLVGVAATGSVMSICWLRRKASDREATGYSNCDLVGVLVGHWSIAHFLAARGLSTTLWALLRLPHLRPCSWARPDAMAAQGWSPLHCAVSQGCYSAAQVLLDMGASIGHADGQGNTALAMAVAQKQSALVQLLLRSGADANASDAKAATPLHIAAVTADASLVCSLLSAKAQPDARDAKGWTPLLAACAKPERWPAACALLEAGASARTVTHGQRLSALMLVAEWKQEQQAGIAAASLLKHSADPAVVNMFGETALHLACRHRQVGAILALCEHGAPTAAQDNDGRFPLQNLIACCCQAPEDNELVDVAMAAILRADPEAVHRLDFGDSSALHTLLDYARLEKSAPLVALKALLDARADPTLEDDTGFTAAHYVAAGEHEAKSEEAMMALLRASPLCPAKFWAGLDLGKKRDKSNSKYIMRRGGHHRIPMADRLAVLDGDVSFSSLARKLAGGRYRQVVALVGAGASTSAGIPDFRSPTGLWANDYSRETLSREGFYSNPERFWAAASEIFSGRKPTKAHALLARMAQEGILRRVYTQNIDGLELGAGVPSDAVVHCHGRVDKVVCSDHSCVLYGDTSSIVAELERVGKDEFKAPVCHCGALLRPAVVFFGESMPRCYERLSGEDMEACDLLLVIGTSLMVYPVAGLVSRVPPLTPRLLLNKERVGVWRNCESNPENYRDVMWEGDCDAGADELASSVGWTL